MPNLPVRPGRHAPALASTRWCGAIPGWFVVGAAVEVLSPSTARKVRYKKRAVFPEEGVPEFWVVDSAARLVERWRPGDEEPDVALHTLEWQPASGHPPLVIDLNELFGAA